MEKKTLLQITYYNVRCYVTHSDDTNSTISKGERTVLHKWNTDCLLSVMVKFHGNTLLKVWAALPVVYLVTCIGPLAHLSQNQGKPGGRPSMGSHRVGHDWSDIAAAAAAAAAASRYKFMICKFFYVKKNEYTKRYSCHYWLWSTGHPYLQSNPG